MVMRHRTTCKLARSSRKATPYLGSDLLYNVLDVAVRLRRATRHHGGAYGQQEKEGSRSDEVCCRPQGVPPGIMEVPVGFAGLALEPFKIKMTKCKKPNNHSRYDHPSNHHSLLAALAKSNCIQQPQQSLQLYGRASPVSNKTGYKKKQNVFLFTLLLPRIRLTELVPAVQAKPSCENHQHHHQPACTHPCEHPPLHQTLPCPCTAGPSQQPWPCEPQCSRTCKVKGMRARGTRKNEAGEILQHKRKQLTPVPRLHTQHSAQGAASLATHVFKCLGSSPWADCKHMIQYASLHVYAKRATSSWHNNHSETFETGLHPSRHSAGSALSTSRAKSGEHSVSSPLIATIDDDVSRLHVLHQLLNGLVHGSTSLHQDDHTPV